MSEYNGLLLVDKPSAMTSHDVVHQIRKHLKIKSVGHAGTLDPFATGLLVILLGKATKCSNYILNEDKTYEAVIRLGKTTDTWDRDGKLVSESQKEIDFQKLQSSLPSFQGQLKLKVPIYSAKKINGKKLYEYAREEQDIEPPSVVMGFKSVSDFKILDDSSFSVKIHCSKGSYIRSWAMYVGEQLGCGAYLEELRRTQSGSYQLADAITLDEVLSADPGTITGLQSFVTIENCLKSWPSILVDGKDEKLMRNGQISHSLNSRLSFLQKKLKISNNSRVLVDHWGVKVFSADRRALLALLVAENSHKFSIGNVFPT